MLLQAIEGRDESQAAYELLKRTFENGSTVFANHPIGHQGGVRRHIAYWRADLGIWAVLEPHARKKDGGPAHRYWNCFGTGEPDGKKALEPKVQMNPPHEAGAGGSPNGLFVRDENNRIYVAHNARLGGSRRGIGGRNFTATIGSDEWQKVMTRNGPRDLLVFGPIDTHGFAHRLADYVRRAADFKEETANRLGKSTGMTNSA